MGSIDNLQCRNKEDRPTMGLTATNTFPISDIHRPLPTANRVGQKGIVLQAHGHFRIPETYSNLIGANLRWKSLPLKKGDFWLQLKLKSP